MHNYYHEIYICSEARQKSISLESRKSWVHYEHSHTNRNVLHWHYKNIFDISYQYNRLWFYKYQQIL